MPSRVLFGSAGGDGIDTAVKLARRDWYELGEPDRVVLLSRTAAYHGMHGFGTALSGIPGNRRGFGPQVETVQVAHDSLDAMEAAVRRLGPERVAAIFVEPVIGAGGVYPPAPGYLEGVSDLCERTGILLVIDSVICGFGRLGTWFGIERWEVDPAMIVFAKGVTSGYLPLGGVLVSEAVAEPFWKAAGGPVLRHGITYSAHATCCAAAIANIAVLQADGLLERGRELEGPLLDTLLPLTSDPGVAEVRGGVGLMAAVELSDELLSAYPDAALQITRSARQRGVLIGPRERALTLSPPLTATQEHFGLVAEAIQHGLATVRG